MHSIQLPYNAFTFFEIVKHLAFNFLHSIMGTLPKSIHYIEFFSNFDSNTVYRILAQPPLRYFGTVRNVLVLKPSGREDSPLKAITFGYFLNLLYTFLEKKPNTNN